MSASRQTRGEQQDDSSAHLGSFFCKPAGLALRILAGIDCVASSGAPGDARALSENGFVTWRCPIRLPPPYGLTGMGVGTTATYWWVALMRRCERAGIAGHFSVVLGLASPTGTDDGWQLPVRGYSDLAA